MEDVKDSYLSIAGESRGIYREKASKFMSVAMPVTSEEEVKSNLDEIRKAYHDANHHCYAYRLGMENQAYRSNDDGEPAGSAGKPIYGQILSMGLSDVLVVVTRYFGGTKLGIPGLIHAYRTAAREALVQAMIIEKTIQVQFKVTFDYNIMNEIMRILKEEGVKINQQSAAERCEIDFQIRKSLAEKLNNRFTRLRNISLTVK
jgi:uncharacterized YigZ family protein